MIISKLTTGFGFAVAILVFAGISKVSFKNYVVLNLVGGFIWTLFLITAGYFFGNILTLISGPIKIIFGIAMFIIIVLFIRFINNYLKNIKI